MPPVTSQTENYAAIETTVDGIPVVRLIDRVTESQVTIVPSLGNNAYEFTVKGKPVVWSPYRSLAEFRANPAFLGNPFLEPWANRIDGESYYLNGRKYLLNPDLGNYRYDGFHQPIHGLVAYCNEWRVSGLSVDKDSAEVTSRLEYWRRPDWMAQFPLAHCIEMTYRIQAGVLTVETVVENLSTEPMPLAIGFHPYFRLNEVPRDAWKVHLSAREHVVLSSQLTPTGERRPMTLPDPFPLAGSQLDDVFTSLVRDDDGFARFAVEGGHEKITVEFGPQYPVAVVYAPPGRDFICFEPMTAVTNAFNLHHRGLCPELQSIASGSTWREVFRVRPEGF